MNRIVLGRVLLFSCLSAGGAAEAEAEIVKIVYERKPNFAAFDFRCQGLRHAPA